MYNTYPYNDTLYNNFKNRGEFEVSGPIILNDLLMQGGGITTQLILHDSAPARDFQTQPVPRGNGGVIIGDYWRSKNITLRGIIKRATNEELECFLDEFKKIVTEQEIILELTIACTQRQFLVTAVNTDRMFARRQGYNINICPFDLDLLCLNPFSLSPDYVSQSILDTEDLNLDEQFFNEGTAPSSPVMILVFTDAVNVSAVRFTNNTTNEIIELNQSVSPGDYVRFDAEAKQVTVNGVLADYNGAFPSLKAGSNFYTIDVTGDSAKYTLTLKHKIPYL